MSLGTVKTIVGIVGGAVSAVAGALQVVKLTRQLVKEEEAKQTVTDDVAETTAEEVE